MADKQSRVGELTVKIDVDVSNALKGLKALQREARETTKALRGLEEQQKEVISHCGNEAHEFFSSMSREELKDLLEDVGFEVSDGEGEIIFKNKKKPEGKCLSCGGDEFIKTELRSYDEEKAIETNIECTKCGWKHNV